MKYLCTLNDRSYMVENGLVNTGPHPEARDAQTFVTQATALTFYRVRVLTWLTDALQLLKRALLIKLWPLPASCTLPWTKWQTLILAAF